MNNLKIKCMFYNTERNVICLFKIKKIKKKNKPK